MIETALMTTHDELWSSCASIARRATSQGKPTSATDSPIYGESAVGRDAIEPGTYFGASDFRHRLAAFSLRDTGAGSDQTLISESTSQIISA